MRFFPIALVMLVAATGHAQTAGEIDAAMKDGFVQGHSAVTIVREEGQHLYGQRTGEWIQRDGAGKRIGANHWVLGVRNGLHQRYEYTDGKATLVESIVYVLGMRHGVALYRDEDLGELVRGRFAWGVRHGTFESLARSSGPDRVYVCGWRKTAGQAKRIRNPEACRYRSSIELDAPQLALEAILDPRRYSKSIAKTICDASKALGVPVVLGGHPLVCPKQSLAKLQQQQQQQPTMVKIGDKVYSGDMLIGMLGGSGYLYSSARFKYTANPGMNVSPWLAGTGFLSFVGDGPVYWSGHDCEVRVDPKLATVEAANKKSGESSTRKLADSPLHQVYDFLLSQGNLLDTFSSEIVTSNDTSAVLELEKKANPLANDKIRITIEFKDFVQKDATFKLADGGEFQLRFTPPKVTRTHSSRAKRFEAWRAKRFYAKWPEYSSVGAEKLQCTGSPW